MTRVEELASERRRLYVLLGALRVHQWVKNLLVFVPLLAAHEWRSRPQSLPTVYLFLAYCLVASCIYLLNDISDRHADRLHPRKKFRAIASGALSVGSALCLAVVLVAIATPLALLAGHQALGLLVLYATLSVAYSLYLKRLIVLDAFVLAGLYSLRIIAGGAAASISNSFWLLAFSGFLFLSLAMVKRCAELIATSSTSTSQLAGRGYVVDDLRVLQNMGISASYVAALVLGLYLNSEAVSALYSRPSFIWIVCAVILFWLSYLWIKTERGLMHDDPIVFAARDPISIVCFFIATGATYLAV